MNLPEQLASAAGQKEQKLNVQLAAQIAATQDARSVATLCEGLGHKQKAIRHDCIKTLYEIAALEPALITPYVSLFLALLRDKDNRMQ